MYVYMCQMYVLRCLSTYNCTCICMSCPGGTERHIKNISLVPRENRCLHSVVDHFRCRRTNSSCNHAHTGNFNFPHLPAHPLHNPRHLPLPQLSSAHSLSLSLCASLTHSERSSFPLSLESIELGPVWAVFARGVWVKNFQRGSVKICWIFVWAMLGHIAPHPTLRHVCQNIIYSAASHPTTLRGRVKQSACVNLLGRVDACGWDYAGTVGLPVEKLLHYRFSQKCQT